jgi:putative N6-adenine-specific DNA methylase
VRGINDRFTVSIDSSGVHLHKRGLKKHPGRAPLRETIAAAALLLSDYKGIRPVIDPMCGAGTFSLEAALIAKNIPPGWFREFAFMEWPSFRRAQWEYLKRQYEKQFICPSTQLIFASDKDPSAAKSLKKCLKQHNLMDAVSIVQKNFFSLSPSELTDQTGLIAMNPPYGRRMGTLEASEHFFLSICERLKQDYKGWKLLLIVPSKSISKKVPFKLKTYPLFHGGLILKLMVGNIS